MTKERKENIQYITAIGFLCTGIFICFLSFFLNEYDIDNGSLWYLGQSVAFCAAVFGLNLMVKNAVFDAEQNLRRDIDRKMERVDRLFKDPDLEEQNP